MDGNAPIATTTNVVSTPYTLNIEGIFGAFYRFLVDLAGLSSGTDWISLVTSIWIVVTVLAYLFSAGVIALLVYLSVRQHQIELEEADKYDFLSKEEAEDTTEHSRWGHVQSLIESGSPSEWRQAIIEADIMLDDVLASYGYPGNSVGEKLKAGDPSRFRTLQDAWDAHKVRNDIAHQGSGYQLTEQMAHRTIAKYRNVFLEFGVIS
ncbi:MAG: hypothetical protein KBC38_01060 [Candidatus Pacebacteria bacterium]|nr:hypothetical protein [Candidatus Paceibacterota bacterium]MBP9840227.1 hypothetical protein [Candidatus Paceibacterota bacterium]